MCKNRPETPFLRRIAAPPPDSGPDCARRRSQFFAVFSEQIPVTGIGDQAVHQNAGAEQQGDGRQVGHEHAGPEQQKRRAVDAEVGDDRLEGQQLGAPLAVEHAVHQRVEAKQRVKRQQEQDQISDFGRIRGVQDLPGEPAPCGQADEPEGDDARRDGEVSEGFLPMIGRFFGRGVAFQEIGQRQQRQQQPSPDEPVRDPVGALFLDDIDHPRDEQQVEGIANQRIEAGEGTHFCPGVHPAEIRTAGHPARQPHAGPAREHDQRIDQRGQRSDGVGVGDAVDAQLQGNIQRADEKCIAEHRQERLNAEDGVEMNPEVQQNKHDAHEAGQREQRQAQGL